MIISRIKFETFNFPTGEKHLKLDEYYPLRDIDIEFRFEKNEDIIELLLFCDALKRSRKVLNKLLIPYVPFSRQDRVINNGEPFSLEVFANLINSVEAREVIVHDPHSDVTPALIKNCTVISQASCLYNILIDKSDFWLVSPDGGALKKIYNFAKYLNCLGVIECSKVREPKTGRILKTKVFKKSLGGKDCYIVDDICDGGRTFIEIAKILRKRRAGKINLVVTHGFFTQGLKVFEGIIDAVYTREGRVLPPLKEKGKTEK